MTARAAYRQWSRRILYFFPFQLLLLHVKKNHMLLLAWLLLFGYITESIGVKYGVPYLFLFPEYFGRVGFLSYAITGFALGGFITAFNLYSYAMHGYRFPFIATIARPFLKFNINNAIIPVLFVLTYLVHSARFQYTKELIPPLHVALHLTGFVIGILLFLALALLYFTRTNTDIIKLLGKPSEEYRPAEPLMDILGPTHDKAPVKPSERRRSMLWLRRAQRTEKWRVETYLTPRLKLMLARSSAHYDKEVLREVLWQNHINGSIFEIALILSFILLGAFSNMPFFAIPAGASAFIFFTMLLMLISALFSWMQGWTGTVVIGVLVLLNILSQQTEGFLYDTQAIGLDYSIAPAVYDRNSIGNMANDTVATAADKRAMLATLEQWKMDNAAYAGPDGKPPFVMINTSGGGLRSLLWTFRCLQYADSALGGNLMDRAALITGSSGGLIGASYYRQLYRADQQNGSATRYDPNLVNEISSDMLNTIAFSFVTNDMFVRYRTVEDGDRSYTVDRGYAFERRLNENTRGMLDVRLEDLADDERNARIPLLVVNPISINDGRRLIIATLPMAFLTNVTPDCDVNIRSQPEAIEYSKLFAEHGAGRIKLTTALRLNASFPYITPITSMPSEPPMRVMDAGVRDNYGYRTSLMFIHTFKDWIAENTSGVVVIQLRDTQKQLEVKPTGGSLISRILDPIGSVYDNFVRIQDQDYDLMLKLTAGGAPRMRIVDLQLRHDEEEQISLSWHLTEVERGRVLHTVASAENQLAFMYLLNALNQSPVAATQLVTDASAPVRAADPSPRP